MDKVATTIEDAELLEACRRVLEASDDEYEEAVGELTRAVLRIHGEARHTDHAQEHLVRGPGGEVFFQSDKHPWCPAEFVPLKLTDSDARMVLEVYGQMHGRRDAFFAADLQEAIDLERQRRRCEACGAVATRSDDEGTPLCDGCWSELLEEVEAGG
jgi:hypothetical protein